MHNYSIEEQHLYHGFHSFIHNVRYPVANPNTPWIVEVTNLLPHIIYGICVSYNSNLKNWAKRKKSQELMFERASRMLKLYCNERCLAVAFMTDFQRAHNFRVVRNTLPKSLTDLIDVVEAKSIVLRNSQVPLVVDTDLKKREKDSVIHIIFVGRYFKVKGGHLILRLYNELERKYHNRVKLTYVGSIPDNYRKRHAKLLSKIEYHEYLEHAEVLERMRGAHILLVPSRFESGPQICLEGMSCGIPQIVSCGEGMKGITEYMKDGVNCRLLMKEGDTDDVSYSELKEATIELVENEKLRTRWGRAALRTISEGILSMKKRNETLRPYYKHARGRFKGVKSKADIDKNTVLRSRPLQIVMKEQRKYCAENDQSHAISLRPPNLKSIIKPATLDRFHHDDTII